MKKYISISFILIILIGIYFVSEALSNGTDTKVTSFNQSIKFENEGNYLKAIESLTNIYESNKNDYLINLRLGWLYYNYGNFNESKKYYKKAIELGGSNNIEALIGLTYPLSFLEEWNEIETVYNNILNIDSNNYTANLRLGQIFLNRTDYQNAKKHLEKIYNYYKSDYEINTSLSWTYYYLGESKKAKELFTNILMISEKDSLATIGINLLK